VCDDALMLAEFKVKSLRFYGDSYSHTDHIARFTLIEWQTRRPGIDTPGETAARFGERELTKFGFS